MTSTTANPHDGPDDGRWERSNVLELAVFATIVAVASLAIAVIVLTRQSNAGSAQASPSAAAVTAAPVATAQHVRMKIVAPDDGGTMGPDGHRHDTYLPSSFRVQAGRAVTVTIVNTDDVPHSFTAPSLGINKIIPGARNGKPGTVTFTFTPGHGRYRWYCDIPCDTDTHGWAMTAGRSGPGHEGFMAGYVTAA